MAPWYAPRPNLSIKRFNDIIDMCVKTRMSYLNKYAYQQTV